ncbi:hypothetical protein [Aquimarina sp. Aq107]|uniref:hypothetical protein n=1 Tax=Aquimarina sp. Aq107 TaxID=1191912 RepID=UPI000D5616A6|nr:hypothetical protein [Aquimarina sp. Aq107]
MLVKEKTPLIIPFSFGIQRYKVSLQLLYKKLEQSEHEKLSFILEKRWIEKNEKGSIYSVELFLDNSDETTSTYYKDVQTVVLKKVILQLDNQNQIVKVYNYGEICECWDESKKVFFKRNKEMYSIKSKMKAIDDALSDRKHFLNYIIDQELYQILFPAVCQKELICNKPILSTKRYTNLFKETIVPIINCSVLEKTDSKTKKAYFYDIESIESKEFDDESLIKAYKKAYNVSDIQLDFTTIRNYSIGLDGIMQSIQSIKNVKVSELENFEQLTEATLLPKNN